MSEGERGLDVVRQSDERSTVLVLKGELDVASATELVAAVEQLRPLEFPPVLDLGAVTFIDSAGLRGLLTVRDEVLRETGAPLCLRAVTAEQRTLFELSGLRDAFEVVIDDG